MSKLSPTKLYEMNNKPTVEELERMVSKLKGEGYYAENLNKNGVIVKGANWVIRHKDNEGKTYTESFSENGVWMRFLGWTKF